MGAGASSSAGPVRSCSSNQLRSPNGELSGSLARLMASCLALRLFSTTGSAMSSVAGAAGGTIPKLRQRPTRSWRPDKKSPAGGRGLLAQLHYLNLRTFWCCSCHLSTPSAPCTSSGLSWCPHCQRAYRHSICRTPFSNSAWSLACALGCRYRLWLTNLGTPHAQ